jgi:hypothetical protein
MLVDLFLSLQMKKYGGSDRQHSLVFQLKILLQRSDAGTIKLFMDIIILKPYKLVVFWKYYTKMEVTNRNQHPNLLCYRIEQCILDTNVRKQQS